MTIKFASIFIYHICTDILAKTNMWKVIKNCYSREKRKDDKDELLSDDENEAPEPTSTIIERPTPQRPLSDIVEPRCKSGENL